MGGRAPSGGADDAADDDRGLRILSTVSRLAGLGITAAGGALGPVLVGASGLMDNSIARKQQRRLALELPEGSEERRMAEIFANAQDLTPETLGRLRQQHTTTTATNLLPGLTRGMPDQRQIPRLPDYSVDPEYSFVPGAPTEHLIPDTRRFERRPTETELLDRARTAQVPSEAVRAALVRSMLALRAPDEAAVPKDVQRDIERGGLAASLYRAGRAGTPEDARSLASTFVESGIRPGAETFLEPRARAATPDERRRQDQATRDEAFQKRLDANEFDLTTPAGMRAAMIAATGAGATGVIENLRKQRGMLREEQSAARGERFVADTLPKLQEQLDRVRTMKGTTPADLEMLESALAIAEDDPSPVNVGRVQAAFSKLPAWLAQREQFSARMTEHAKRVSDAQQRAQAAMQARNFAAAEANVKFIIRESDAEIRRISREAEFADPQTRQQMLHDLALLEQRRNTFQAWLEESTGRRAVSPSEGANATDRFTITPRPGMPPKGPERAPLSDDRRRQLQDEGILTR